MGLSYDHFSSSVAKEMPIEALSDSKVMEHAKDLPPVASTCATHHPRLLRCRYASLGFAVLALEMISISFQPVLALDVNRRLRGPKPVFTKYIERTPNAATSYGLTSQKYDPFLTKLLRIDEVVRANGYPFRGIVNGRQRKNENRFVDFGPEMKGRSLSSTMTPPTQNTKAPKKTSKPLTMTTTTHSTGDHAISTHTTTSTHKNSGTDPTSANSVGSTIGSHTPVSGTLSSSISAGTHATTTTSSSGGHISKGTHAKDLVGEPTMTPEEEASREPTMAPLEKQGSNWYEPDEEAEVEEAEEEALETVEPTSSKHQENNWYEPGEEGSLFDEEEEVEEAEEEALETVKPAPSTHKENIWYEPGEENKEEEPQDTINTEPTAAPVLSSSSSKGMGVSETQQQMGTDLPQQVSGYNGYTPASSSNNEKPKNDDDDANAEGASIDEIETTEKKKNDQHSAEEPEGVNEIEEESRNFEKEETEHEDSEEQIEILEKEEEELEKQEEVLENELSREEREVRRIGGFGVFLAVLAMIFTAHQMSENPDGIYASFCRLILTLSGCAFKVVFMPFRSAVTGSGSRGYGHISTMDYGYRNPYSPGANQVNMEMS